MTFETLGDLSLSILGGITMKRVGALDVALVKSSGEIERVAWLRATDQKRRIDSSLLTENYSKNWDVTVQGEERMRQAHLLQRAGRKCSVPGRTRQLS